MLVAKAQMMLEMMTHSKVAYGDGGNLRPIVSLMDLLIG